MRRHLLSSAVACATATASLGFAVAPAIADSSTATTPPAATNPSPPATAPPPPATTPPAPMGAAATLSLPNVFAVDRQAVSVPGRAVVVTGVVRPYVAGQWVDVQAFVGRKRIKSDRLRIKPTADTGAGQFTEKLVSPRSGLLKVKVTHSPTPQMLGFAAQRRVALVAENAGFGSRGQFVALIQQRLAALHVFIPQTGVYDQQTGLAVDAYHRLIGRGTAQTLDGATISDLLNGVGSFKVRNPHDGKHVEGNLSNQLMALIYGSRVYRIYPISSGKPSTPTILGHFHVYLRDPGYLPDGMYYSDFFYGGYAIHGYDPAPDYPASHGCMRIPIVDAIGVFNWLTYGDVVDVYG